MYQISSWQVKGIYQLDIRYILTKYQAHTWQISGKYISGYIMYCFIKIPNDIFLSSWCVQHKHNAAFRVMGLELNEGNCTKKTDLTPQWSHQPFMLGSPLSTFYRHINKNAWCCFMTLCAELHTAAYVATATRFSPTRSLLLSWVKLWDWEIYRRGHWMFHIWQPFLAKSPERGTLLVPPPPLQLALERHRPL